MFAPSSRCQDKYEKKGLQVALEIRKDPLHFFTNLMNQKGAYTRLKINGRKVLVLNDARGVEYVLQENSKNYRKGHFQNILKSLFGKSMFLDEGENWRKGRVRAAPVFASGNFEEMVRQMVIACNAMFERWDSCIAQGKPIDMTLEMTQFALDALLRALFHESRDDVAADMRASLGVILRDTEERLWSAFSIPEAISHNLKKYRLAKHFLKEITAELIQARRNNKAYPEDLLSRLVKGFGSSHEQQKVLYDEVLSFILAGHDTTAHALTWTLYTLAHYPLEQERMQNEVDNVLKSVDPTIGHVTKMSYTRQIFDEILRLYPPVWTMSREAIEDDIIPLDKAGESISVSADTAVMMCHYAIHRREEYWPNPEAFDPEHFSPEAIANRPKYAWFPFGGGPRQCLGFRFAQVEAVVALAMITRRYQLSLIPGQKVVPEPIITLRPSGSVFFRVRKRNDYLDQAHIREQPPANIFPNEVPISANKCPFSHAGGAANP